MLDFMPMVVLTSKLCPSKMESTVYALLAGYQNFGQVCFVCCAVMLCCFVCCAVMLCCVVLHCVGKART